MVKRCLSQDSCNLILVFLNISFLMIWYMIVWFHMKTPLWNGWAHALSFVPKGLFFPVCTNKVRYLDFQLRRGGMQCFLARESKSKWALAVFTAVWPAMSQRREHPPSSLMASNSTQKYSNHQFHYTSKTFVKPTIHMYVFHSETRPF